MYGEGVMKILESAIEYRKEVLESYNDRLRDEVTKMMGEAMDGVSLLDKKSVDRAMDDFRCGLHVFMARLLFDGMSEEEAGKLGIREIQRHRAKR